MSSYRDKHNKCRLSYFPVKDMRKTIQILQKQYHTVIFIFILGQYRDTIVNMIIHFVLELEMYDSSNIFLLQLN